MDRPDERPSRPASIRRPRIVLTIADPKAQSEPELNDERNRRYAEGVERHGGEPVFLDPGVRGGDREAILASMDGLLLTGGADLDPALYDQPLAGSREIDRDRDELEIEVFNRARVARVPIFGICRGSQALNVFLGGTLLQHVPGHIGDPYGHGDPLMHHIEIDMSTALGRILGSPSAVVNSYHHQAVRPEDLAPGLVPSAWAESEAGTLVEGFELPGDTFLVGVQCHPERSESTPDAFEALWATFLDAARAHTLRATESATPGGFLS